MLKRMILALMLSVSAIGLTHADGTAQEIKQPTTDQEGVAPEIPVHFGGTYLELDRRRQQLVDNWVARYDEVTHQKIDPGTFYDSHVRLSAKTTFEAVTHALMTTPLSDPSGERFGDALDLVERVDSVSGSIPGTSGDRQFRIYARLKADAIGMLDRSQEFKRGRDNTVYHKGYPTNYREQGGAPSIQISVAPDGQNADIDVDYRSASFPESLFNGHLTSANSDVRAGNNYDRHTARWAGFKNWWLSFFGVGLKSAPGAVAQNESPDFPVKPRAGKKNIDAAVEDFLKALLIDGDIMGATSYISQRAYACLAEDSDDPFAFDRGMAPLVLMSRLRAVHEALGEHDSLDGLTIGVHVVKPGLKVVQQRHHKQFVLYSVPDDIAAAFDCASSLTLGDPHKVARVYGNYFGATFYVSGPRKDSTIALLWQKEDGYWKIVSWRSEPQEEKLQMPLIPADVPREVRIKADPGLIDAAQDYLESWLIRKDYDAAFRYISPEAYPCYNLVRTPDQSKATSQEDAGQSIRASLEKSGQRIGEAPGLDSLLSAVEPINPALRVLDHPLWRTFTLISAPDALAAAFTCAARASGERFTGDVPLEYGKAYGMFFRFQTQAGDAPVLRAMWVKENDAWRITAYDVELP